MAKILGVFFAAFFVVFALDQAVKQIFLSGFSWQGEYFSLVLAYNRGVAFSMFAFLGEWLKFIQLALIAGVCGYLLWRLKRKAVVATVMSNAALEDYLKSHKIKLLRANVGDKYVLEKMKENGTNFGGEQSGHIIFSDYAKTGDGLVAALQFAALVLKKGKKASEILSEIKPYPQILLNLKITEEKPLESIAGLKELEASLAKEGIRSLFRYSGTENLIRLLIEGKCADALKTRMDEVEKFFLKALNG